MCQRPGGIRGWSSAVRAFEGGECGFEGDGPQTVRPKAKKRPKTMRDYYANPTNQVATSTHQQPALHQQPQLPNTASATAAVLSCTVIHSSAQSTQHWAGTFSKALKVPLPSTQPLSPTIDTVEPPAPAHIAEGTSDPSLSCGSVVPLPETNGTCKSLLSLVAIYCVTSSFIRWRSCCITEYTNTKSGCINAISASSQLQSNPIESSSDYFVERQLQGSV